MIVVDADVIAAFWIQTPRTPLALRVRKRDAEWIASLFPQVAVPMEAFVTQG